MAAGAGEVLGLKIKLPQFSQIFRTHATKLIQQFSQGFALAFAQVSESIERSEWLGVAELQNDLGAWYPVGAVGMNQMGDDVECGPSLFAFIAMRQGFRQVAQKCIECGGSATEKRNSVFQVMRHFSSRSLIRSIESLIWRRAAAQIAARKFRTDLLECSVIPTPRRGNAWPGKRSDSRVP